jgi:hypothetical protein
MDRPVHPLRAEEITMGKWSVWGLAILVLTGPVLAESKKGKAVLDIWEAAYLPSGKTGYFHISVVEKELEEGKRLRSTFEMNLTLKRFKDTISLRAETGMDETPEGKITGVFMRHYLGKQQQLAITGQVVDKVNKEGRVVGKEVSLSMAGKGTMKWTAPWNDKAISLYRQRLLFQERKAKPGDTFEYLSFEPSINLVVKNRVKVHDYEEVSFPGSKKKRKLLKVEIKPDEIRIPKADGKEDRFQGPTLFAWLDQDLLPIRSQMEMPGLGKIVSYRTTKEEALKPGAARTDMGLSQMVRLNKRLARPLDLTKVVFRITIKGEKDAASAFARDERQVIRNARGKTFEMVVSPSQGPAKKEQQVEEMVSEEFSKSSYFINCDDTKVKQLARKAVGKEKDTWKKVLRIERWVKNNMKWSFGEELATADHVARTLEGDCTEHAMLAAAMCRAVGVPSRTAVGMVYANSPRGPAMGFHMWTEVWVNEQWVPIDATLGRGGVGATHIKISDQSWHEVRTLVPLLPFIRVVGKVKMEIVSAE